MTFFLGLVGLALLYLGGEWLIRGGSAGLAALLRPAKVEARVLSWRQLGSAASALAGPALVASSSARTPGEKS